MSMNTEHPYIGRIWADAAGRDMEQRLFLQTLETLLEGLGPCLEARPYYEDMCLLERLSEPERMVSFPVLWRDDQGRARTTRGYYVRHSTVLGPCRGGAVFRAGLNMSVMKAMALESTLENSLAGLPLGGSAAGADVDTAAMSSRESARFCQSFMAGLYPCLPPATPPETWLGEELPRRELGYLQGQYERLTNLTRGGGPAFAAAGPMTRARAAGYGACYFAQHALRQHTGARLEGRTAVITGRDGPAAWAGEKAVQVGARVVAVGTPDGYLYAPTGLPLRLLRAMARQPDIPLLLRAIPTPGVDYCQGPGLWDIPADVFFLCDVSSPMGREEAERLAVHYPVGVFEGASLACGTEAARYLGSCGILYSPGLASGAGGAALTFHQQHTPGLSYWEADRQLRTVMGQIFQAAWDESVRAGAPGDLARGARNAAFLRIGEALAAKGI